MYNSSSEQKKKQNSKIILKISIAITNILLMQSNREKHQKLEETQANHSQKRQKQRHPKEAQCRFSI